MAGKWAAKDEISFKGKNKGKKGLFASDSAG
jgi:hypothetical protein